METRTKSDVVMEGFVAGLLGAASVMVVYWATDIVFAKPFYTPASLQALLFEGPDAVPGATLGVAETMGFTLLHFIAWIAAGCVASLLVSATDATRGSWYFVTIGVTAAFCAFIWATGVWRIDGFDSNHLWVGALIGSGVMAGFFAWKHPQVITR